jgi:cell division protein FtsW
MTDTAAATPTARAAGFSGWFSRAKSGIDALPMHLPVRLGNAGMTQTKAAPVRVLGFDQPWSGSPWRCWPGAW